MQGWIRRLKPVGLDGFDGGLALEEVRRAIEVERRVATSPSELRVDAVRCLDSEQGLWQLEVSLPATNRLENWAGAFLWRDLTDGGTPWTADVMEANLRRGELLVETGPHEAPEVGMVRARPFDFLRAPWRLVDSGGMQPARKPYSDLLGASLGACRLDGGLRPGWRGPAAWDHPWAMVWGPPGTGKTTTLVAQVARLLQRPGERVLVVSTTHRATDEVAIRLGAQAEGVLRIGAVDIGAFRRADRMDVLPQPRERMELLEHALERLARARRPLERAQARRALVALRRGLPQLPDRLAEDLPRCIVTTVHAALRAVVSDDMGLFFEHSRAPFTTVVVDEAGLVPRATAAALGLLAAHQVVLVGDPRQLSPICVASRSLEPRVKRWLALSAMEHAAGDQPATQALTQQHRMHPEVRAVVSALQYDGALEDGPTVLGRAWPDAGRLSGWPRACHVVLDRCEGLDASNVSAERGEGRSWVRPAGIEILERLLGRYPELARQPGLFISPYRGQAQAAEDRFEALGIPSWSASTVHAQQGTEAPVVVFDLVRHGGWPVPEWKRLANVALSRAQQLVLVLAAETELSQPWLSALAEGLRPCTVTAEGALVVEASVKAQADLFGVPEVVPSREEAWAVADPGRPWTGSRDAASLGVQIDQSRAARRSLTKAQSQLVRRSLQDLGPRVVRGVAGSGKTIVLARWVAGELATWDRRATVVFGNTALEPQLRNLLEQAWRVAKDQRGGFPWDRVDLVHMGTLLGGLAREAGLAPAPEERRFDIEWQAQRLREQGLAPRLELLYIDEAQDLGHEGLGLLLSLVCRGPQGECPARFFYDNAQNVYRRSTPRWRDFGLDMRGQSTVLRESFRSTRPGMEFALDILDHLRPLDQDPDMRELINPRRGSPLLVRQPSGGWRADFCVVQGQAPEAHIFGDIDQELGAAVATVGEWLDQGVRPRDVRVLAATRRRCQALQVALQHAGIDAVFSTSRDFDPREPRVLVTTAHSFKGYEAELVAVVGLDGFCSAKGPLVEALYVALTRARTWMWVSARRVESGAPGRAIVDALERAVQLRRAPGP